MHANSRVVLSNQDGIHYRLSAQVAKHASTPFLKPVTAFNREAFDICIAAWRAAGSAPLILDAGCGVGLSTLHLAIRFPDHFVIGIDQSADRLARKTEWPAAPPANCLFMRADLVDFWRLMLAERIHPRRHYLLYPNPWPKKRHLGRRWHGHPIFPTIVALGGYLECRSNWRTYIDEWASALNQLTGAKAQTEPYLEPTGAAFDSPEEQKVITPFEAKYLASGHSLWRCWLQLRHGSQDNMAA